MTLSPSPRHRNLPYSGARNAVRAGRPGKHLRASTRSIRKGTSRSRDPRRAAQDLYDALYQPGIRLAVFYCASDFDLPALATAPHRHFGDINLIRCTCAGEITPLGHLTGILTGFSLASPELNAMTQLIGFEPFDAVLAGKHVEAPARRMRTPDGLPANAGNTIAFLLIDGLATHTRGIVPTLFSRLTQVFLRRGPGR